MKENVNRMLNELPIRRDNVIFNEPMTLNEARKAIDEEKSQLQAEHQFQQKQNPRLKISRESILEQDAKTAKKLEDVEAKKEAVVKEFQPIVEALTNKMAAANEILNKYQ